MESIEIGGSHAVERSILQTTLVVPSNLRPTTSAAPRLFVHMRMPQRDGSTRITRSALSWARLGMSRWDLKTAPDDESAAGFVCRDIAALSSLAAI